jgi:hypothetical protein
MAKMFCMNLSIAIFTLILGLLLLIFRPLARAKKISSNWEIAFGALAIIGFFFFIATNYIVPTVIERDLAAQPCGSESPQGACYTLTRSLCEAAWQNADLACKAELSVVQKDRPTALIGPKLNRCKARRMDQTLHFNRINNDSVYCRAYFDYIAGPEAR